MAYHPLPRVTEPTNVRLVSVNQILLSASYQCAKSENTVISFDGMTALSSSSKRTPFNNVNLSTTLYNCTSSTTVKTNKTAAA